MTHLCSNYQVNVAKPEIVLRKALRRSSETSLWHFTRSKMLGGRRRHQTTTMNSNNSSFDGHVEVASNVPA